MRGAADSGLRAAHLAFECNRLNARPNDPTRQMVLVWNCDLPCWARSLMTAARTSPVSAHTAMNTCRSTALYGAEWFTNGPNPLNVPHTAPLAMRRLASAAPAIRKRIAAQTTNRKTANANTSSRTAAHGPKTAEDTPSTAKHTKQSSRLRQPGRVGANPDRSSRAAATPAAGQTGDTLALVKGTARPSQPAAKYTANAMSSCNG
jgi:hypothetical protein